MSHPLCVYLIYKTLCKPQTWGVTEGLKHRITNQLRSCRWYASHRCTGKILRLMTYS
jgi:hypothetical protein